MSCSGFGPPSETPADLTLPRCLRQPRQILSPKEAASEQLPCMGLGAGPRTASQAGGGRTPVGLYSKTSTLLSRLVAALCLGGNPGLLGKGQTGASEAKPRWHLWVQLRWLWCSWAVGLGGVWRHLGQAKQGR